MTMEIFSYSAIIGLEVLLLLVAMQWSFDRGLFFYNYKIVDMEHVTILQVSR